MLIGASELVWIVETYRMAFITGRRGGHKTSLAFRIAAEFLDRKDSPYKLLTNAKSVWGDDLEDIKLCADGKAHLVCILDEGGIDFRNRFQVETIAQHTRRMDLIILMPSWSEPAKQAQEVLIEPIWSLKPAGIPYIHYRWVVKQVTRTSEGFFGWVEPSEIYGVYSSMFPSHQPSDIVEKLVSLTEDMLEYHGANRKAQGRGLKVQDLEGGWRESELVSEVLDEMEKIRRDTQALAERATNRRRRR